MVKQLVHAKETGREISKDPKPVEKNRNIATLEEVSESVRDRLSRGLSIGAVIAILKAVLPPGESYNPFFEEENLKNLNPAKLEALWDKLTATPWVQNHIESLVADINRRLDAEPRKSIPDLVADLDVTSNLKPGFIVAFDLNGYSKFLGQATNNQKKMLDEHLQKTMFGLCEKYNITLLQAPAGDCYIYHFPYQDSKSKRAFDTFLKELSELNIPTGLANPDSEKFPNGNFRASIGWSFSASGETKTKLYTGPAGSDQGITHVSGAAFVNALNAQDKAGDGEIKSDIPDDFDYEAHTAKVVHLNREKKYEMPKNKKLAVAVLSALIAATHPKGSFSQYAQRRGSAETTLPELRVTSIAANIGDGKNRKDLAEKPEKYDAVLKGLLKLQEKYPEIRIFKIDVNILHLSSTADLQKGGAQRILQFAKELALLIESEELEYGIGIEYNASLVRINVKDSTVEERSGNGISVATKMSKEKISQPLRVGRDFAGAAWGNVHELTLHTEEVKGIALQVLPLELDDVDNLHKIHGKELIGAEEQLAQITNFVEKIGKNGSTLEIKGMVAGAGVSARIRFAMREADRLGLKRINLEREGGGPYALLRGFIKVLYPDFKAENDEELFIKAEDALVDNGWKSKSLLTCDLKNLSPVEADFLRKVASSVVGFESGLIYSESLELEGKHEVIEVEALSPAQAAELIFKNRPDLTAERLNIFDQVVSELQRISSEGGPALIPANVVHIYLKGLRVEATGTNARFELGTMDVIRTGEFAIKVESENPERQFLVGLVAYINVAVSRENLWTVYSRLKPDNSETNFNEDLEYLCDQGFLLKSNDGYSLKNSNFRATAQELLIDHGEASREVLKIDLGEGLEADEAKFNHLLEANGSDDEIRKVCLRVIKNYQKNSSLQAARDIASKYLTFKNFDMNDIKVETVDFYLSLAWALIQSASPELQIVANMMYEKILTLNLTEGQREKAIWGLYRICNFDSLTLAQLDAKRAKAEPEKQEELFNDNLPLRKFKELQEMTQNPSTKYCMELAQAYQEVLLWKHYKMSPEKRNELRAKVAALHERIPEFEKDNEVKATCFRLLGGCYTDLAQRAKAREVFAIASRSYDKLEVPDQIQANDCKYGDIFAEEFIICFEETPTIETEADRETVMMHLDNFENTARAFLESTIRIGDQANRMKILKILAEINEIRMLVIAKKPLEKDTKSQIQRLYDNYSALISQSFKIRRILKPNDVLPESKWLDELHESMSSLPKALQLHTFA